MGIEAAQKDLSLRWLARLTELLPVQARDVFPSDQLLDHIPGIILEIARYLRAPHDEEFAANTTVIEKARELGLLRHSQQASVHQILREYELLGSILEAFVAEQTPHASPAPEPLECLEATRRVGRAVQTLMQITVDTFIAAYTETITRQTEQLASFNRMVGHELRNPLNTIQLVVGILTASSDEDLVASRARLADLLQRNLTRMAAMLRRLEAIALAQEEVDTPCVQAVDLRTVASEVARQLDEMAKARGVEIRIVPDLPLVKVETARLELALLNLVSNAIKYSDPAKTERWVEIGKPAVSPDDGHWALAVRDNGIGIPGDALPHLLHRRFFRAHGHRDEELGNDGTGLGLSIVQECVRSLGGTITLESVEGKGTSAVVTVPDAR
jgi:signal transduction histidine kinase